MHNNNYKEVQEYIDALVNNSNKLQIIVAIDGRCASGKTTLATYLGENYECNIFHMDDFFLPPSKRTQERLEEPGGNVDYERFLNEVLKPLKTNKEFEYSLYNCKTQSMGEHIYVTPSRLVIIEGAYSCRPELIEYYDLKIFMTIDEKEQKKRISQRNGEEAAKIFESKWIPYEEKYFKAFNIKEKCDVIINNE